MLIFWLRHCSAVIIIFTLSGPETLDPKLDKAFHTSWSQRTSLTYFFHLKWGTNYLCELKSSVAKETRTDLIGLEGKSLKKGTEVPFTDTWTPTQTHHRKYTEGEFLVRKKILYIKYIKYIFYIFLIYLTFSCLVTRIP